MDKKEAKSRKIVLTLSWKMLSMVLILALAGLCLYTKPWEQTKNSSRTIDIKGEASIKRAPDSFVFNPSYEATSQKDINEKARKVVEDIKALGLGDAGIQTSVSNYEKYDYNGTSTGEYTYSLYMTLSVEDKELAQKVQDYLADSGAVGSISPSVGFTRDTKKELKDEATTKAVEDARARAEKTAQNLGVKLGKVVTVKEPEQFDEYPIAAYDASFAKEGDTSSLPINAGESEFNYSVTVQFEIR